MTSTAGVSTRADDDRSHVSAVVVDLGSAAVGSGGAIWSLPHGGDLDANLVRLAPGRRVDHHVNDDLDVLLFVHSGTGRVDIDGEAYDLRSDVLALIPARSMRSITAGMGGLTYLSVHRRRGPLTIGSPPPRGPAALRRPTSGV